MGVCRCGAQEAARHQSCMPCLLRARWDTSQSRANAHRRSRAAGRRPGTPTEYKSWQEGSPWSLAASGGYIASTAASRPRCAASTTARSAGWSCPTWPAPPPRGAQPPAATRCATMLWLPPSTAELSALRRGEGRERGDERRELVEHCGVQLYAHKQLQHVAAACRIDIVTPALLRVCGSLEHALEQTVPSQQTLSSRSRMRRERCTFYGCQPRQPAGSPPATCCPSVPPPPTA